MKKLLGVLSLGACLVLLMGQGALAAEAADIYKRSCAGCHGQSGEKKTGGTEAIKGKNIQPMLAGYKDGSFGGKQKATMQNIVKKISDEDLKAVADYVKGFK